MFPRRPTLSGCSKLCKLALSDWMYWSQPPPYGRRKSWKKSLLTISASISTSTRWALFSAFGAGLMMVEQESGGAVVTIGDWAIERPYLDHAAYFVSKGAIPTLTKTMAVELAARNPRVRVNCIHPGPVMAPPGLSEEELQARIDATLVKDADDPETMVRTVLYFIDNSFVTGVCLPVDGGRTIYAGSSG